MGCGASTLDENGVIIPIKARPLLFLRLEEFRRRRHPQAFKDSTPSQKGLLLHDRGEDRDIASINQKRDRGTDSCLLADDTGSCVTSEEGSKGGSTKRATRKEEDGCNNGAKVREENSIEKGKGEDHDGGRVFEPLAKNKVNKVDQHTNGDFEDDDQDEDEFEVVDGEGRTLGRQDILAFPRSPSFRVYFKDNEGDNKIEDSIWANADMDDHFSEETAPIDDDSTTPSKQSLAAVRQEAKKDKKKRSFRKVLPTGRQAKSLFHVKACMSSPSSSHYRTHLLTAKPHA